MEKKLDLKALVGEADGALLEAAVQALYRERGAAYHAALSVAAIRGEHQPSRHIFGIDEAFEMILKIGTTPKPF